MATRTLRRAEFCFDPTRTPTIELAGGPDDADGKDPFSSPVRIIIRGSLVKRTGVATDGGAEGEIVGTGVELTLSGMDVLRLAHSLTQYVTSR